jgi:putative intracellular protease/amidase
MKSPVLRVTSSLIPILTAVFTIAACATTPAKPADVSPAVQPEAAISQVGAGKTVLIVMSAKNYITMKEGKKHPTGFFMSELAVPAQALIKAGYKIEVATPRGTQPTMDKVSDAANWFGGNQKEYTEAKEFVATLLKDKPKTLEKLDAKSLDTYAGVFVPGGHAPMEDLSKAPAMGRVLNHFHAKNKPTALICHGPTALFSAKDAKGKWTYAGYKMTIFSTAEEKQEEDAGRLDGHMKYYPEAQAKKLGGLVTVAKPWTSSAMRDRELVTGQNPMSDKEFAALLLDALAGK